MTRSRGHQDGCRPVQRPPAGHPFLRHRPPRPDRRHRHGGPARPGDRDRQPRQRRSGPPGQVPQYRKAEVRHYWVVDPQQRTIESYRLAGKRHIGGLRRSGSDVVRLEPFPDMEIPLARLWRRRRQGPGRVRPDNRASRKKLDESTARGVRQDVPVTPGRAVAHAERADGICTETRNHNPAEDVPIRLLAGRRACRPDETPRIITAKIHPLRS